ncbi:MAG: hypothetical protein HY684_04185 [Chloroflexi bacterium]|nr:hypothetical protein [Chloroflexota bacterium]
MWKFMHRKLGHEHTAQFEAVWEVALDPISDEYVPEEISAHDLFDRWAKRVREKYADGLIPIHWFVNVEGTVKTFEGFPFAFDHLPQYKKEDFLSFFTWPEDARTGEPLNWLTVPVVDKLWHHGRANKGGFIQEATGWKPAILQPHVYLPALERAVHRG